MSKALPDPLSELGGDARRSYLPLGTVAPAGALAPARSEPWLKPRGRLRVSPGDYIDEPSHEQVKSYALDKPFVWSGERVYVLTDVHADADAFERSLVAAGAVVPNASTDDFVLTPHGRDATFIVAGDCFDKGPRNLDLLRALGRFIDSGARVVLLAGNHDVRALVGMCSVGERDPKLAHLFVRMGKKVVPLFREICDDYLSGEALETSMKTESRLHRQLFPPDSWYDEFATAASDLVPPKKIEQELNRIREKTVDFEAHCVKHELTLTAVVRAIEVFRTQFLQPGGDFHWFFDRMQLAHRIGSFLFVHAGVDDRVAAVLRRHGVDALNQQFRDMLDRRELFDLYHGPIGNAFRTKYRETDYPLTDRGREDLHAAGIYAVVHGHRNMCFGQRVAFRAGVLNFECDASVDRNTRAIEGLSGPGGAVTIFRPDGAIVAISADYPAAKVFDPAEHCRVLTISGTGENGRTERWARQSKR